MSVPVLICGFNRPQQLRQVFAAVREAKPSRLFLSLDYPRSGNFDDVIRWRECMRIFEGVDWECDVYRNYAEVNMGCRRRMASAITWAFDYVDKLIICEDDCVPHRSFFDYVKELLERYEGDERIAGVCGFIEHYNFCRYPLKYDGDYYFDRLNTCWCWATWKRAWNVFDESFDSWPEWRAKRIFKRICRWRYQERKLEQIAQDVYDGHISSWATVWWLSCLNNDMLFAHPKVNMVSNVGFGEASTHTKMVDSPWANLSVQQAPYPICHPDRICINRESENYLVSRYYAPSMVYRFIAKVLRLIKGR